MKIKYIGSKPLQDDVHQFIFEAAAGEAPVSWQPGQFLHITIPHDDVDDRGDERWFTISSAPSTGQMVITTRINEQRSSSFKAALNNLEPGSELESDAPDGNFVVDQPDRQLIFVAGGIGITPYHSILAEAGAKDQKLKVNLLYANRDQNIIFKDELDQLSAANPDLKIEYIVQPTRIDKDLLKARIAAAEKPIVYVSGPEPMVEAFAKDLHDLGLTDADLRLDYFPGYKAD